MQRQSAVNPAGQLGAEPVPRGQELTYTITAKGRLVTAEEFGQIVVRANPDGSFVRLQDLARIELGAESYAQLGRFGGKTAAIIAVYQQPDSNALAVANEVKATMALVLSSVFLPVAFMGGVRGRLFQQFALTIACSVILSAFNALTLSPALAALLLRPRKKKGRVLELYARVDEDRALRQGVDLGDLYTTLSAFMGGAYVNDFNRFGRQWRVYLAAEGEFRVRAESIARFYVRSSSQAMVPLSTLVTIEPASGPQFTSRFNLYRAAEITGAAAEGYSSGQAMAALAQVAAQTLPREMGLDWSGMSYQEQQAGGITGVLALSVLLVFLILAALYESWSLPFSVLLATPVAIFGALVGLLARQSQLDVYAQIGLIMLVGLSAKNAILIVEFARAQLDRGGATGDSGSDPDPVRAAALAGAKLRLRPILMTSFAFILGMLPLWAATGAGGVSRRELGTAVIVGLLFATLLGVFLVPVLFVSVEKLARGRQRGAPKAASAAAGSP